MSKQQITLRKGNTYHLDKVYPWLGFLDHGIDYYQGHMDDDDNEIDEEHVFMLQSVALRLTKRLIEDN